jgi:hypothetical protein
LIFLIIGVIIFFLLFGCAYEFFLWYQNKTKKSQKNSDINSEIIENYYNKEIDFDRIYSKKEKVFICIIIFLGILCQPFYLFFYLMYFLLECLRVSNGGCIFF